MENIIITGITGQDGIFITSEILKQKKDATIYGITRQKNHSNFFKRLESIGCTNVKNINLLNIDLKNEEEVFNLLTDKRPNYIINLSGPSSVYESLNNPEIKESIQIIFNNLTSSLIKTKNFPKFFQASSSEMYGKSENKDLNENSPFNPNSPYAQAKLLNHKKVLELSQKYNWKIYSGIMFNHESQFRDDNYLFMKVIKTAEKIKDGKANKLTIGSLNYERDWSYSLDVAKAILFILDNGIEPDYVIGSGKSHKIEELIDIVFDYFGLEKNSVLEIDNSILRKNDPVKIKSNPSKILNQVGWKAEVGFEELVKICIELKD